MKIFTQNDLLLFIYKETSPALTRAIEKALTEDWELAEELRLLQEAHTELSAVELQSPRAESILNVLNYARETMPTATV